MDLPLGNAKKFTADVSWAVLVVYLYQVISDN